MSYPAKSVVLDIADCWGGAAIGIRSIDFYLSGVLIDITSSDAVFYATTSFSAVYLPDNAFLTAASKTGSSSGGTSYLSDFATTNTRLIVVFNTAISFDQIIINNYHSIGYSTTNGVRNVKIYTSSNSIADTTYGATISGSSLLFDDEIRQHTAVDEQDDINIPLSAPGVDMGTFISESVPEVESIIGSAETQIPHFVSESLATVIYDIDVFLPIVTSESTISMGFNEEVPLSSFVSTSEIFVQGINSFLNEEATERYILTITGIDDGLSDVEIPISSFQYRFQLGSKQYLSVVIPSIDYIDGIEARSNGQMVIDQCYELSGVIVSRNMILKTGSIHSITPHEGATSTSIVMDGYVQAYELAHWGSPTTHTLNGSPIYKRTNGTKLTYRLCQWPFNLKILDVLTIGSDQIRVYGANVAISADGFKSIEISGATYSG